MRCMHKKTIISYFFYKKNDYFLFFKQNNDYFLQNFAYVQFLLYLCAIFWKDNVFVFLVHTDSGVFRASKGSKDG